MYNPNCKDCELHKSAQKVCLSGSGPVPSKIMMIGEAPGFREDDTGKPFSGKAGQLLDKILQDSGLSREDIYITNVCKCRPPENRTPKATEIKACAKYLDEEFKTVKPKFVILLGAVPLKAVLKKAKITEIHGRVFEKDGIFYMPTFHPAMALRDPKRLDPIHADFDIFSDVIDAGKMSKSPKLNLTVIHSFDEFNDLIDDIRSSREVAFDTETKSLEYYKREGINCLGIATKDRQWILPLDVLGSRFQDRSTQQEMIELIALALKGKKVIAQNGKFDNHWLRSMYGVRFPITFDTMLAAHILDENSPNSLDYLSRAYFKAPNYDIPLKDKTHPDTKQKVEQMFVYCAYDVYYTLKLYYLFRKKLKNEPALLRLFIHLIMPLSDIYEDAEEEGVTVNVEKLDEVEASLIEEIALTKVKLLKFLPEENQGVNWNSPQQVAHILFKVWSLKSLEKTKGGSDSTGESILKQLAPQHKGVDVLLKYRELHKQYSGFIKSWKDQLHEGKLHPSFKLHGTVTGRPSCTGPNLQQVPRDSTIRSLIIAPPGWDLVEVDQSQIELRIAAMLAGERTMKMIFQTGGDIHTATAQEVAGKEVVTKDERKKAKAVNFGFVYGMGWRKFKDYARDKYGVHLNDAQSRAYRTRYFEKYYDLPRWHEKQRRRVKMFQEVKTLTGRVRRLPSILSTEEGTRAEAERQSVNSPVQGFAAEVTLMGLIAIRKKFSWDIVRPIGTVHDAILILIKKGYLEKVLPGIIKEMENPPLLDKFEINMTVPLVAEATVGPWGSGQEYKPPK